MEAGGELHRDLFLGSLHCSTRTLPSPLPGERHLGESEQDEYRDPGSLVAHHELLVAYAENSEAKRGLGENQYERDHIEEFQTPRRYVVHSCDEVSYQRDSTQPNYHMSWKQNL